MSYEINEYVLLMSPDQYYVLDRMVKFRKPAARSASARKRKAKLHFRPAPRADEWLK